MQIQKVNVKSGKNKGEKEEGDEKYRMQTSILSTIERKEDMKRSVTTERLQISNWLKGRKGVRIKTEVRKRNRIPDYVLCEDSLGTL